MRLWLTIKNKMYVFILDYGFPPAPSIRPLLLLLLLGYRYVVRISGRNWGQGVVVMISGKVAATHTVVRSEGASRRKRVVWSQNGHCTIVVVIRRWRGSRRDGDWREIDDIVWRRWGGEKWCYDGGWDGNFLLVVMGMRWHCLRLGARELKTVTQLPSKCQQWLGQRVCREHPHTCQIRGKENKGQSFVKGK